MASVYSKQSPQDAGGSMTTIKRIEQALMGMWHMMTESRGGSHSTSKTVFTVFLLLFDFVMTAALIVHPDSQLGNVLQVTIHDLLPQGERTVFLGTYIGVLAVVWFALFDGAYVAWSFHIGHFRSLWPAQFLRAFIGIIGTALYNPFLEVLIIPLRCSKLAYFYYDKKELQVDLSTLRAGANPWVAHDATGLTCPSMGAGSQLLLMQAATAAVSVLALVLFIPFALSTQLVYIDSDPSSEVWEALSNGREVVVDSIMRTLLVGFAFFVKDLDIVAHGALCVILVTIVHYRLVKGLPFFRTTANMARSELYGVLNWLAIECLTLGCLHRYGASIDTVKNTSLGMVATLPFIFILSGLMPLPQYTFLTRHLRAVMIAVDAANAEKELAEAPAAADAEGEAAGAGTTLAASRVSAVSSLTRGRSLSKGPSGGIPAIGDGIILAFNRFMTSCSKLLPLPPAMKVLDAGSAPSGSMRNLNVAIAVTNPTDDTMLVSVRKGRSKDAVEAAERFGGDSEHVENLALLALKTNWTPGLMTHDQHTANCSAGLFSKKAIAVAESVFEQGLLAFPHQPGVRVAYARFLASYSQDSMRAIAMLQTALRCNPRLEDRFALFSFGRTLDQQRQSSDLGEGQMDAVGVIAFRQTQSQALLHHHEAVKHIHELWTMIVALQTGGAVSAKGSDSTSATASDATQGLATKLTEQIAKIVQAKTLATADYEKLMVRYPNAALLLRSYQAFATDVLCDPGLARMILNRIEALERPDKGDAAQEMGEKSSFVGSVGTKKSGASSTSSTFRRGAKKGDNAGSQSVSNMKFKMQLALLALLLLACTIFAVAMVTLQDYGTLVDVIHRASTRRYNIVALAFHTRTLVLSAGIIVKSGFDPTVWCRPGELCTTSFDLARQLTIQYSTEMQKLNADLYDPNSEIVLPPDVKNIYDSPERYPAMQVLEGPPPLNTTIRTNLLSMLIKYSGNCLASAQMPVTRLAQHTYHYSLDPIVWRYVQDNWVTVLEGANEISEKYVDLGFNKANVFAAVAFSLLGVVVIVLLVSWSCIFWPAALSVQRTNAGVTGISGAIPLDAVKALVKRYERLESQLAQLASQLSDDNGEGGDGDEDGEEGFSDRGFDDDDDEGPQVSIDGEDGKPFVYQPEDEDVVVHAGPMDGSEPKSPAPTTLKSSHPVAVPALALDRKPSRGLLLSPAAHRMQPSPEAPLTARARAKLHAGSSRRDVVGHSAIAEAEREKEELQRANNAAESVLDQIMSENRAFKKDMVDITSPKSKSARKGDRTPREARTPRMPSSEAPPASAGVTSKDDADQALFQPAPLPGSVESPMPAALAQPSATSLAVAVPAQETGEASAVTVTETDGRRMSHSRQGFSDTLVHGDEDSGSSSLIPARLTHSTANAAVPLSPVDEERPANRSAMSADAELRRPAQATTAAVPQDARLAVSVIDAPPHPGTTEGTAATTGGNDPQALKDSRMSDGVDTGKKELKAKRRPSKHGVSTDTKPAQGESSKESGSKDGGKGAANDKLRSAVRRVSLIKQAGEGVEAVDSAPLIYKQPRGKARITVCCCKVTVSSAHKQAIDRTVAWLKDTGTSMLLLVGGQKNLLSPLLRSLSMRVAGALFVVLTIQSIGAALSYQQIVNGAYTASAINVAGFRRELTITSTFHARELLIGPDIIGTYAFAVDVARAYADKLEAYHMGLLKGNEQLRLRPSLGTDPAQDNLIEDYDAQGLSDFEKQQRNSQLAMIKAGRGIGASNITEQDFLTAEVASMGLHYLVMRYIDAVNSWLATYEPWLASDTPGNREIVRKRYGMDLTQSIADGLQYLDPEDGVDYRKSYRHNMTNLYTFPKYRELEIMSFGLLDARLLRSLQLYLQQVTTSFRQSTIIQVVVIVLNFSIILFLQFGVFARQFKKLAAEAERTEELIKLIPKPVLSSVPKLRALVIGTVGATFLPKEGK